MQTLILISFIFSLSSALPQVEDAQNCAAGACLVQMDKEPLVSTKELKPKETEAKTEETEVAEIAKEAKKEKVHEKAKEHAGKAKDTVSPTPRPTSVPTTAPTTAASQDACDLTDYKNAHEDGFCQTGDGITKEEIASGKNCTVQCEDGYVATDGSLTPLANGVKPGCTNGVLEAACEALKPCALPTVKFRALNGACATNMADENAYAQCMNKDEQGTEYQCTKCLKEGQTAADVEGFSDDGTQWCQNAACCIASGSNCTAQCLEGYTQSWEDSGKELQCLDGEWQSPVSGEDEFECDANPCKLTISNGKIGNGAFGAQSTIASGSTEVQATCDTGREVSVGAAYPAEPESFICSAGVLKAKDIESNGEKATICTVNEDGTTAEAGDGSGCIEIECPKARCFAPKPTSGNPENYDQGSSCIRDGFAGAVHDDNARITFHGDYCDPKCKAGYEARKKSDGTKVTDQGVRCHEGNFTFEFECVEKNCPAPDHNHGGMTFTCSNGQVTEDNKVFNKPGSCTVTCAAEYTPKEATLDCERGEYSEHPSCEGNPCLISSIGGDTSMYPTNSNNAGGGPCAGTTGSALTQIEHDEKCITQCKDGYTAKNSNGEGVHELKCNATKFDPPSFECQEKGCPMPSPANGKGVGTNNLATCEHNVVKLAYKDDDGNDMHGVHHGHQCTPACEHGYELDEDWEGMVGSGGNPVKNLTCNLGVFTPTTFKCKEADCEIASKTNMETCTGDIKSQEKCSPTCKAGYSPTIAEVQCFKGKLVDASQGEDSPDVTGHDHCEESPCLAPPDNESFVKRGWCAQAGDEAATQADIFNQDKPAASIAANSDCKPMCMPGYEARKASDTSKTIESISCSEGNFDEEFTCETFNHNTDSAEVQNGYGCIASGGVQKKSAFSDRKSRCCGQEKGFVAASSLCPAR